MVAIPTERVRPKYERAVLKLLRRTCAAACLLFIGVPASAQDADAGIPGFTREHLATQRALELRFLAVPTSASAAATVQWLAARPHLAGTPETRRLADSLAARMRALGFEVEVERFDVWLPHPVRVRAALVSPAAQELQVREPASASGAADSASVLWNWLGYSANGDVTAPVVYANFGLPDDYGALARLGVDVRGAIVIARMGRSFRGVKSAEAERRGAAGLVLYADPSADGFAAGDTVPLGPYRPSWSVQRGTLLYMWRYTGDPLTPGRPAIDGEPRIPPEQATNLPRIPVITLSYAEAAKILAGLGGQDPPAGFRGALPVPYRTGPGPTTLRIASEQNYSTRPIYNVIARLRGREEDRPIILGNHFDAWVSGAADPHVGTAVVYEIAKGLGRLTANGWRPRRTITLAFWDAEEFGVVGSTEWVEKHASVLAMDAVAYFNIDTFTSGTLDVSGSPALRDLVHAAARDVEDPLTRQPLAESWARRQRENWRRGSAPTDTFALRLGDIGAGSDWTAFLHFAGVPSLQWTMNGRGTYAVYHSSLDHFPYARTWVDSAFVHTPALARVMGIAALRLAEADVLPFRYSLYAQRIDAWLDALEESQAERLEMLGGSRIEVRSALFAFEQAARRAELATQAWLLEGNTQRLTLMNHALPRVETAFLSERGLPGRSWYRHQLSAPGSDTGYDPLPLPALIEALRENDRASVTHALAELTAALQRATQTITAALGGN